MTGQPSVPLAPLLAALADDGVTTNAAISERTGIHPSSIHRALKKGYVTVWVADDIALRVLGRHPVEIYGDAWLDQHAMNVDVERANRIDLAFAQLRETTS